MRVCLLIFNTDLAAQSVAQLVTTAFLVLFAVTSIETKKILISAGFWKSWENISVWKFDNKKTSTNFSSKITFLFDIYLIINVCEMFNF